VVAVGCTYFVNDAFSVGTGFFVMVMVQVPSVLLILRTGEGAARHAWLFIMFIAGIGVTILFIIVAVWAGMGHDIKYKPDQVKAGLAFWTLDFFVVIAIGVYGFIKRDSEGSGGSGFEPVDGGDEEDF